MDIQVREIRSEDYSRWRELYAEYLRFYETALDSDLEQRVWHRLIAGEIHSLIAITNGEIVGIAHFHIQISTWAINGHLYLEDLYVDEAFRKQGIARQLIAAVEDQAKEAACSEMYWITRESNAPARALYDSIATKSNFVRYEIKFNAD